MSKTAAPLGILGDGQLALMLAESATRQGFDFLSYGDDPTSSFASRFPENFVQGSRDDLNKLRDFAGRCSVITLENEFYPVKSLEIIENDTGIPVVPNPASYRFFESKLAQRSLYESLSIPGPRTVEIKDTDSDKVLTQIEAEFSYPFVLKKSVGGYDGYGVAIIASRARFLDALEKFGLQKGSPLFIEEKVSIAREFAQGALFDGKGGANFLPLVETIQRNGICELVLSRSTLEPILLKQVETTILDFLSRIAEKGLKGLFNFEFFLDQNNRVLINEGAPRPHNSQHLSMDASPLSQFDLLTYFCVNDELPLPAGNTLLSKPGVMINLLGKSSGQNYILSLPEFPEGLESKPKLYLKKECRPGRKMGHLNLVDPDGKLDLIQIGEKTLKEYHL